MLQALRSGKSAFTLIEILIASAIFATIMVMTAGIISQSSTYQEKIKAMRETADDTRKLADAITGNVRSAKGETTVRFENNDYSSGVIMLFCDTKVCKAVNNTTAESGAANTLVTFSKDSYKVIYAFGDPNVNARVYALSSAAGATPAVSIPGLLNNAAGFVSTMTAADKLTTRSGYASSLVLNGFAPFDGKWNSQPYVKFTLVSKTPNYDSAPVTRRAIITLQSSVALRNYK